MAYYLEPYTPIAIKKVVNDGYHEGLFNEKSIYFNDGQLKIIYNYIRKHGEDLEFIIMKYNYYYLECTFHLN